MSCKVRCFIPFIQCIGLNFQVLFLNIATWLESCFKSLTFFFLFFLFQIKRVLMITNFDVHYYEFWCALYITCISTHVYPYVLLFLGFSSLLCPYCIISVAHIHASHVFVHWTVCPGIANFMYNHSESWPTMLILNFFNYAFLYFSCMLH